MVIQQGKWYAECIAKYPTRYDEFSQRDLKDVDRVDRMAGTEERQANK
jgi:hypothetical protein